MIGFMKKACFLSLAWLLGLILVLVVFEGVLRVIYYESDVRFSGGDMIPSQVASELSLPVNFEYEYDITEIYEAKGKEKKIKYVRDEFAIRNACGDPKNIDILTVGGSTTEQRYVKNDSTFQAVIENLSSDDGKEICVANAGIAGHSTYGHIRAFQEWFPLLPDLAPKYVLLYVGINDVTFHRNYEVVFKEHKPFPGIKNRPIKSFIRKTYLSQKTRPFFQYLKGEIEIVEDSEDRFTNNDNFIFTELNDDTIARVETHLVAFRKRFETLLEYVDAMGAEPICVTQPHRNSRIIDGQKRGLPEVFSKYNGIDYDYSIQQLYQVMENLCGDNLIDIYPLEFTNEMFYDGVHTTDIGSEFIGEKIYEAMKEKGMLEVF